MIFLSELEVSRKFQEHVCGRLNVFIAPYNHKFVSQVNLLSPNHHLCKSLVLVLLKDKGEQGVDPHSDKLKWVINLGLFLVRRRMFSFF